MVMLIDLHGLSASHYPVQALTRQVSIQMASDLSDNRWDKLSKKWNFHLSQVYHHTLLLPCKFRHRLDVLPCSDCTQDSDLGWTHFFNVQTKNNNQKIQQTYPSQ